MKFLICIAGYYFGYYYYQGLGEPIPGGIFYLIGWFYMWGALGDFMKWHDKRSQKKHEKWKAEQELIKAKKFIEDEARRHELDIKRKEFIEKHGWDPWKKKSGKYYLPAENDYKKQQ